MKNGFTPPKIAVIPSPKHGAVPLPEDGFVRLPQIIGDPKAGIPALIPVSASTWWHKCKTDPTWPQPIKLTERCTVWKVSAIRALIAQQEAA